MKFETEKLSHIVLQETSRDFRTEVPNIVFELIESNDLPPNALILYLMYRRIAGEHGACWIGTRGLSKKCQLSCPTITKLKKVLSTPLKKLGGKSLIHITPGNPQLEEADTVTITDIWPENYRFFKNKLTCVKERHRGVQNEDTGVCKKKTHKKEPFKKEPYKNPPLSSPQKIDPLPKNISLRSEEEEVSTYDFLDGTNLSPKEKQRLSKEFSREEVLRALKISETQTIKKTLMHLLISILKNPDKWQDPSETQLETHQQHIASSYNESLRKSKKLGREPLMKPGSKVHETRNSEEIAKENDQTIKANHMKIFLNGFITQVSLNSSDFEQDIKHAIAQLR